MLIATNLQKKEAASGCQRPKSREETPKEGGGITSDRDTALRKYERAPHKKQESHGIAALLDAWPWRYVDRPSQSLDRFSRSSVKT